MRRSPLTSLRIVLAKPGMDAHWRGAAVVARVLRDAGAEVVYLGHASVAAIAATVAEEDADAVGLSTLSGNHLAETEHLVAELAARGLTDVAVLVGGAIPTADAARLVSLGASAVLPTGTGPDRIVEAVARACTAGAAGRLAPILEAAT